MGSSDGVHSGKTTSEGQQGAAVGSQADLPSDSTALSFNVPIFAPQGTSLPFVNWSAFEIVHELGSGRSGVVYLIRYNGAELALKLFDLAKRPAAAFNSEVEVYAAVCSSPAAGCVPEFKFLTESPSGLCVGFAMELGQSLPSDFDLWEESQLRAASSAVDRLFQAGVTHNDIDASNFIQTSSGKVLAIDLEGATVARLSGWRA